MEHERDGWEPWQPRPTRAPHPPLCAVLPTSRSPGCRRRRRWKLPQPGLLNGRMESSGHHQPETSTLGFDVRKKILLFFSHRPTSRACAGPAVATMSVSLGRTLPTQSAANSMWQSVGAYFLHTEFLSPNQIHLTHYEESGHVDNHQEQQETGL